jgi:translation initiation factor 2B subunit (eIF-2B alpha/beta/delta family)
MKSTIIDVMDYVTSIIAEVAKSKTSATMQVLKLVSPIIDQVSSTTSWQTHNDFINNARSLPSFMISNAPKFQGL